MTPETPQRKHRVAFPTRAAWLSSSQSSYFKLISESNRNRQTKQTHSCPQEVPDLCRHQASLPQLVLSSPSFSRPTRSPSSWYDSSTPLGTTSPTSGPTRPALGDLAHRRRRWGGGPHGGPARSVRTRVDTNTISIKYVDFAGRLVAPYLLVEENEDEKFFHSSRTRQPSQSLGASCGRA